MEIHKRLERGVCVKCKKEQLIYTAKGYCRGCYRRTPKIFLSEVYTSQLCNSRKRDMPPPEYTANELKRWIITNIEFRPLYLQWLESKYLSSLKPSIDRISDTEGYSLNNIQLMTWAENKAKGELSSKQGMRYINVKSIVKLDKVTEEFLNQYKSFHSAERENTGVTFNNIASAVTTSKNSKGKKIHRAGNYKWISTLEYLTLLIQDISDMPRNSEFKKIDFKKVNFNEDSCLVSIEKE